MKVIHHVLDVDARPEKVWQAVTGADGLAGWWSTRLEADPPAVGGTVRFTFAGDFNPVMQIVEIDPPRRLRWRCVEGHANWKDNTFTFEMVPLDDNRCRLRFTQDYAVELSDDDYGVYNFNWGYYLESLRLLCVTGVGKPFSPA
ncbi:MAG TPA: SRPBCC domain-containing protein [Acidimicrobiales bacterium]|nr:SRPBCC domain-containing protein [Acidimicrobiales bacterium]